MQRRLPLLVTTGADPPPRQRTMRFAIGWSYELLTDAERRILRRLSVFRSSFGAQIAHAIAGVSPGRVTRATWSWACAWWCHCGNFWWFCGSYAQAAVWLEALLTLAENGSTEQAGAR